MKKTFLTILLLIIIILAASPWVTGLLFERQLKNYVQSFQTNPNYKIDIVDYQRGYLHSQAKLRITLTSNQNTWKKFTTDHNKKFTLYMQETIQHGPIIWQQQNNKQQAKLPLFALGIMHGKLILNTKVSQLLQPFIGKQALIQTNAIFHFNGNVDIYSHSAKVNYQNPQQNLQITFPGFQVSSHLSKQFKHLDLNASTQPLSIQKAKQHFSLAKLDLTYHGQQGKYDFWFGKATLALPKAQLSMNQHPLFVLNQFDLKQQTEAVNDQKANYALQLNTQQIKILSKPIGPIQFNFNMNGFALKPVYQLQQKFKALNQLSLSPQVFAQQAKKILIPTMMDIAKQGVQLQINPLSITTPRGSLKLSSNIILPAHSNPTAKSLLNHANIRLNTSVPNSVLQTFIRELAQRQLNDLRHHDPRFATLNIQQRAAMIEQFSKQLLMSWITPGYLQLVNNHYQMNAIFNKGKFKINGITFKPPALPNWQALLPKEKSTTTKLMPIPAKAAIPAN